MPQCLKYATVNYFINGVKCATLVNSGSLKSYIKSNVADALNLVVLPKVNSKVILANTSTQHQVLGVCCVDVEINGRMYKKL